MFKDFLIYVYNRNLDLVGIIDAFSSLRWRRKYFEAGEFELHLSLDNQTQKFLKKDYFLVREDAVEVGIIESMKINDDGDKVDLTIIGRFLSSILDRRIVKKKISFNGKILDGERKILNEMTPFKNLVIKDTDLNSDTILFQCTYKNVYNYLNNLAKRSTIAHRIVLDIENKKLVYENYQGLDRTESQKTNTRYEFSDDRSNIENAEFTFDAKTEKNYALVGGSGEGENRIIVEVKKGDYDDFDLRETFVDASSEAMTEETSLEDYKEMLKTKGSENLTDKTEAMEVTVYADDYKKGWDLGDIVNVKKEKWNVVMKQRVTEIEETIENGNQKIFVTFGTPLAEALQEDNDI